MKSMVRVAMVVLLTLWAPRQGTAQRAPQPATGTIVGRIVDAGTGQPLVGAQVTAVGTGIGATTNMDGRYALARVPSGPRSIQVLFIGYSDKTVENVIVPAGATASQDVAMTSSAISLAAITVSATRERGTVSAALNEQRNAVGVVSATTAAQIARSPDSDAAQAVQRVSGVSVRDGKYVFVRGLGERYTTTSLNGARVPSPEPEKKVVPLDLFPSNLLEAITTSKTFTPDQAGDFSGAQVNLRTRSFPSRRMVQFSASGGYSAEATGRTLQMPTTLGGEWFALAAGGRALPADLTGRSDFTTLTQPEINGIIRSMPKGWLAESGSGAPNASASVSVGGEDEVLGRRLGYIGSLSYSRSTDLKQDEERARAVAGDAAGTPVPYNRFSGSTATGSVLWGGLLNFSTYLGQGSRIELNNTYDRTADNEAHEDWGTLEEFQQVQLVRRTSLRYVERTVRSNQLRGEHLLGQANRLSWSVASSAVSRNEPDRADLVYGHEEGLSGERLPLAWLGFIPEAAKRTTSLLNEGVWSVDADYLASFGPADQAMTLRIGGAWRATDRDATSASYNLRAIGLDAAARAASPRELFHGQYTEGDARRITIEPNSSGGTYSAQDHVTAGFAMAEVPLGGRVRVIGGARVEQWNLDMEVEPTSRALINIARSNTDVLPSLAVNVKLRDDQTLRLSASQTLARPEYRELAPVSYRDMLGEREVFGDSSLVRTLVQNYDMRWEWYPDLDEAVSIGFFAKRFRNPIEPIDVATSGASQLSFINAESAVNYGAEVEVRKGLGLPGSTYDPFVVFANVTLMHSRINTSNSTLSALTNDERPMVGQAPYVVNTGVSYANESGSTSATLLYNVVGRRITSAAVTPITVDTYEEPRHLLDFSVRFPLLSGIKGKLDARNLLDSPHEERQGDVIRYRYRTGRSLSFGLTWSL